MTFHLFNKIIHRLNPEWNWKLYSYKARRFFNKSQLILSFDCDTEDDISCVEEVHSRLESIGITPVYAVPGELLKKGSKVYSRLFDKGAQFINHGGRSHTYFDEKHRRHASCFFYDQQEVNLLREDIVLGHKTLQEVLGVTPTGWRTPHFGTFQSKGHLAFLYRTLRELNYTFSTSTIPEKAFQYGPVYQQNSIVEIPVTGIYQEPFNIMDTWAYFSAPNRTKKPCDYVHAATELALFAKEHPMLINIYGDPSHIHNAPEFFEAMEILVKYAESSSYSQLLEHVNEKSRII